LIQGLTALPALTGKITGEPRYSPAAIADRIVGLNATHAILAALIHRDRTGEGQAIEIPMFETMAQFVLGDHMAGRSFEPPIGPSGYSRLLSRDRRPTRPATATSVLSSIPTSSGTPSFARSARTTKPNATPA
jgi:crotonobetainyl-CoA:carnitine CoA-transferase CaiB-like acyl-CoA transferase